MSLDSMFKTEEKKKPSSCASLIAAFVVGTLISAGIILTAAFLAHTAVTSITADGWSFWPVLQLTTALYLVGYWAAGRTK